MRLFRFVRHEPERKADTNHGIHAVPLCHRPIAPNRPQKEDNLPQKKRTMDGTVRANIKPGMLVNIVLKKDQRTGVLTEGIVKNLLTSAPKHHRGIKVRLEDGQIGRVQEILEEDTN